MVIALRGMRERLLPVCVGEGASRCEVLRSWSQASHATRINAMAVQNAGMIRERMDNEGQK